MSGMMTETLPQTFWTMPKNARTTMTTKRLRAVLTYFDGHILACGESWNIKSKRIGPGMYEVTLEPWKER